MKTKWIIGLLFSGALFLTSCEKDCLSPLDENGKPYHLRGGEDEANTTGGNGNGITDGGHGSDYDNSGKNKKNKAN